jgi:putative DNA primase/helicase
LQPPESVRAATDEYFTSEDTIAAWIEERCTTDAGDFASNGVLWRSWEKHADKTGERVGKKKRLLQALEDRGFEKVRTNVERGFRGIAVKPGEIRDPYFD